MQKSRELISSIFKHYHSELQSEIDKANALLKIKRIYDSGQVLELAIDALLSRVMPDWIGITRGVVIDTNVDETSNEIDLILYDKRYFPGLVIAETVNESISCVSIDVVVGIISVKKKLTLKSLKEAITNIKSVTDLQRKVLKNQLHNDISLDGFLSYKNGKDLGGFFSCIIAYENDLFYRVENKEKRLKTDEEIKDYFDKKSKEDWFNNITVDHIYTVDGTVFYPLLMKTGKWDRTVDVERLGSPKKVIQPFIKGNVVEIDTDYCLAYSHDFANPEISLGNLIGYLQYYGASLVKSTPAIHKWFDQFQHLEIKVPMTARNISSIK